MKKHYVLGIETTCDETSFAILENGTKIIKMITNSQMEFFKNYGGVVPELASRNHTKNIMYVYDQIFEGTNLTIKDIDLIAVATNPGLKGSIIVGLTFAKTLSLIHNIKLIEVNHLHGHLLSAMFEHNYEFPIMALSVSGGHSNIVYFKNLYEFEVIGSTLDDSLGEAFDKVSMMLELGYPGGPYIEQLAKKGNINLKMPNINTPRYSFSYSGFKTFINQKYIIPKLESKADIAASFQEHAFKHILKKYSNAIEDYNVRQLLVVGGVSANKTLQSKLQILASKYKLPLIVPSLQYCGDNGAMIALSGYINDKK